MAYSYINVNSCFGTGIALLVAAVIAVTLRLRLRCRDIRVVYHSLWSQHLDDLFCLLALIPTIGTAIVLIYGAKKNIIGSHNDPTNVNDWITTTTPTLVILEKLVYITFILQPIAIGCTKLSLLFYYRRIFTVRSFQHTSLVLILLTVGWTIAFFFGFVFDCGLNFAANWGSLASIAQNCPFGFQATIAYTVLDAAFDLIILVLPLPWIWRLRMPTTRKIQVCGIFLLGSFAVAAALLRMVICIQQNTPSNALDQMYIMGMPTYDIIGITSHGLFWTVVETNVALIACCLPTLRTIISKARLSKPIPARRPIESTTRHPTTNAASNKELAGSRSSTKFHFHIPISHASNSGSTKLEKGWYEMSGMEEEITPAGSGPHSLETGRYHGI